MSQPIRFGPCDVAMNAEGRQQNHLPEISEFTAQSTQYASSSSEYVNAGDVQFHTLPAPFCKFISTTTVQTCLCYISSKPHRNMKNWTVTVLVRKYFLCYFYD